MSEQAPTLYIFHGPDEFSRSEQLAKFKAQMGDPATAALNISIFDGGKVTLNDIRGTCDAMPFLSDKRLVIVENLFGGPGGKAMLDGLLDYLPLLPDWARLVFVEDKKLASNHRLIKLANDSPGGRVIPFDAPRNATSWILKHAEVHDTDIEPGAAQMLAEVTGHDLRIADSELAKLANYVNGERPITKNDILLLTPYTAEISVFEMVDGLGERSPLKAAHALQNLLEGETDMGAVLRLFGMVARQIRLLIVAKDYLHDNSQEGMASALKLHSFVAQKLAAQSRNFSQAQLEDIHRHLLEADLSIKTGRMEPRLALEVLVATLTAG